jgi:nucleoside-diphosphate-sugar epimerase
VRGKVVGSNVTHQKEFLYPSKNLEDRMKILFIGGTGIISSACSQLALVRGMELFLLNRGQSTRPIPQGAKVIHGDIRVPESAKSALGTMKFDAVVDWVAFTQEHIESDLQLFQDRTDQFVFISSASAYQTPPAALPVQEYSRDKIACEERLIQAYREEKFPITIVRPSHTYDRTLLPMHGGWTVIDRMLRGEQVIVHGDGTSLWTLTHNTDFAKGFVGLLGNSHAIGDIFHITSDEWLTWNQIFEITAHAAGTTAKIVHIPSDLINAYDSDWGAGLLGDKAHSFVLDNSKIKRLVPDFICTTPFSRGILEIIEWYRQNPAARIIDQGYNQICDRILAAYAKAWPEA